jgi:hypothetical protein
MSKDRTRMRAELFMELPDRVVLEKPMFPPPSREPPKFEKVGRIDKLEKGNLPDMTSKLPDEDELWRWNRESQDAFWGQRKAYWSRLKLSELQRECRKRDLWPGGEGAYVRDRLARYECCRKTLTAWETKTEEQDVEERSQIGVVYYDLIKQPIDLLSIRGKVKANEYAITEDFERDMRLLFSNARRFDEEVNLPDEQSISRDADALEAVTRASLVEWCNYDWGSISERSWSDEAGDFLGKGALANINFCGKIF